MWDAIQVRLLEVNCWNPVWYPMATPKHAFVMWLVRKDSLTTMGKTCEMGF